MPNDKAVLQENISDPKHLTSLTNYVIFSSDPNNTSTENVFQ